MNYFIRTFQDFRPVDLITGAKQLFLEPLFLKNSYFEEQLFLNRISQWLFPTTLTLCTG